MMRYVVLITLFALPFVCMAQSGTAFLIQCGSSAEVRQKHIMATLTELDPKAVVSFQGADVKVRFTSPQEGATISTFLFQSGLDACRARTLSIAVEGSGMAPEVEGTIGTGPDQRRTVITER